MKLRTFFARPLEYQSSAEWQTIIIYRHTIHLYILIGLVQSSRQLGISERLCCTFQKPVVFASNQIQACSVVQIFSVYISHMTETLVYDSKIRLFHALLYCMMFLDFLTKLIKTTFVLVIDTSGNVLIVIALKHLISPVIAAFNSISLAPIFERHIFQTQKNYTSSVEKNTFAI